MKCDVRIDWAGTEGVSQKKTYKELQELQNLANVICASSPSDMICTQPVTISGSGPPRICTDMLWSSSGLI